MTCIDINAFLGTYPFRDIGEWTPTTLLAEMEQLGITESWISWLPAVFWRDPAAGNAHLYLVAREEPRLKPVPAVHPGMPRWQEAVADAAALHAPCLRCDPLFYGMAPGSAEISSLIAVAAEVQLPLMMAVRLEDVRQRHPNDQTPDLTPAMVRGMIRSHPHARLIITHADREFIEQVHFGATPDEASRILWDISCIWGPPEDHLEILLETVGISRFTFGTGAPLRLAETSIAKLDLLPLGADDRLRIEAGNLGEFLR
jgi:hypothetical protein